MELKRPGIGHRIHLFHLGGEDIVGTTRFKQATIRLQITGVRLQIILVIELRGIDKDGNDRHVILFNTSLHQRGMTLVKSAHRGHQSDFLSLLASLEKLILKVYNLMKNYHFFLNVLTLL